jgi:hypothetical protein
MNRQKYTISIATYQIDTQVISNCSDITFINQGSTVCILNGQFNLAAGTSLSISAQNNEIDITQYRLDFPNGTIANNNVTVIKKNYI